MTVRLLETSERYKKIQTAEEFLDNLGISVVSGPSGGLRLVIDGVEYRIGRDSDVFPRIMDESFTRED